MLSKATIGWDLGGAHLKVACLDAGGAVSRAVQLPCPLWKGLTHLDEAIRDALSELSPQPVRHALTMTGELVDLFPNRRDGVKALVDVFTAQVPKSDVWIYAGKSGFVSADQALALGEDIASANWMATVSFLSTRFQQGLLVDIGSTTTDIVPFGNSIMARGRSDHERLALEELVYTGVVRTSLMAVVDRIPFGGEWVSPMAEHFATMADVYRLIEKLPDDADQMSTADGRGKSIVESARRFARMLGRDMESASLSAWRACAEYIAEAQLQRIDAACRRILSRGELDDDAPIIGAGIGRFIAKELARRLSLPYVDFSVALNSDSTATDWPAHCAPAVSVAALLQTHFPALSLQPRHAVA